MKLWFYHLTSRLCKTLFFLLSLLFCLYVFIDLSIHGVRFLSSRLDLLELFFFYLYSFSRHLDIFFSLAFLLATLKVFFDLMHHSELVALQMAGLSKRKLSAPLFLLAALLGALSLANSEWLSPNALESIDQFRQTHAKKRRSAQKEPIHSLQLEDGSTLVFQQFDPTQMAIHDLYWIRSQDEIWHMKRLELKYGQAKGAFIDCFNRTDEGAFQKTDSFSHRILETLAIDPKALMKKFAPYENRSLSRLWIESLTSSSDRALVSAHFHYKIVSSLLPFLITLSLAPSLLSFSRTKPLFLISCASLFALICYLTLLDGMLILAENRVLPPAFSIWILWILSFIFSLKKWSEPRIVPQ